MTGSTFSPPKPSQENNLHFSMLLLEVSFDPCISLYLWHTRLREREREEHLEAQGRCRVTVLTEKGKGQLSWGRPELLGPRAATQGRGHTTARHVTLTPAQCLWHVKVTGLTTQPSLWSCCKANSPWRFNLSGKSNPSHVICLKTLTGLICISARDVDGDHSHRHWSISCPWHLCGLLVQLRQQL